jgi:predicted dehydrogenase
MLAENYPFTQFNLEMQRLYRAGEIGRVLYAEGEYNHPMGPRDREWISPGEKHWRHYLPSTYYCTHALAPLMTVTGEEPVSVIGLSVAGPECDEGTARVGDPTSVILCRTAGGAVFRIFGLLTPGHSCWYRFHGTAGAMESERGGLNYFGTGRVRVWHEEWDLHKLPKALQGKTPLERIYHPDWPAHGEKARAAGHGGGDFWTSFEFSNAIRSGKPPFLDVYRGVNMSVVGVLAWKSALQNGQPFDMPDFRSEKARKVHENDHWSPFPKDAGPGQPPWSVRGYVKADPMGLKKAKAVWKEAGWKGD